VLAAKGHVIHEAGTTVAARGVLARGPVDLALVDGVLPDGDGIAFIEEMRGRGLAAKIIFLSAVWREPATMARLEALGVTEILQKPILPAELALRVGHTLRVSPPNPGRQVEPSVVLEQLAALGAAYGESLGPKLAELRAALPVARAAGPNTPAFRAALGLAHKLHGTAGTYGFVDVSAAGGAIEAGLEKLRRGSGGDEEAWAAIHAALLRAEAVPRSAMPALVERTSSVAVSRVLVVDDDPAFLREIELVGKALSFDVLTASDSVSALELARREPVDVALVDVTLRDSDDAFELIAALRALPGREGLPVAGISANVSVESRVLAVRAGATLFLGKPIEAHELSSVVRRLLDGGDGHRSRVLVIDDDLAFAASVADILAGVGLQANILSDVDRLFDALAEMRPELLLVDATMPVSGLDVCRIVRASPTWSEIPIVLLVEGADLQTRNLIFRVGADDYAEKPVNSVDLVARIKLRLRRARSIGRRAFEDPLTGLLTRDAFSDRVVQRLAEAARRKRPLSIALLDLDRFKHINDTYGHLAGDRVLRGVGRLLRNSFRTEDVRGRWGGEEFVVALYEESAVTTALPLERALAEFRGLVFQGEAAELFSATFSAGVSCFPEDGRTLDELIRTADARLYAAKRAGRNRIWVASALA
jgi:diguanylate cyclase (GGDEF)-like protein